MTDSDTFQQSDPERAPLPPEVIWLQQELAEAQKTLRTLQRQTSKAEQRQTETNRAYNLTVANLAEARRERAQLLRERDMWKTRAENSLMPVQIGGLTIELTPAEVSAIRRAMARLHHPDTGGDADRMKAWNTALDPLESS